MALVVVLGMLVLVLVLVVAFLSSVSVELQSAKRYSSGADARALADSAVNLVISQIQDATSTPSLAWASQPGMLRTYDANGNEQIAYKLYSSGTLRVADGFNPIAQLANEVPNSWASDTSLYTDLNKPVAVAGNNHYPIIDPSAVASAHNSTTALAGGERPIEGCYLDGGSGIVATSSEQTNVLPLPVQWMYVLKDGSIAAVNASTKKVTGATADNPIVGRVAFWTDDETSKVNVNTASEGTFWDRPWASGANGTYEFNMAVKMPVQNEFQRIPGHPATTSLSVIFPPQDGESALDYKERIYAMIPRISGGGSQAGTVTVTHKSSPIVNDNDRLFASVDEFFFSTTFNGSSREPTTATLNQKDIEKTRFFLTTSSRAPEVNLFNKPRVTLWPLQANTGNVLDPTSAPDRNSKDKLIAFCSTIGTKPYYFQRYNTYTSPSQNPIPSSQSPIMDWDLIPRNRELYAYLQDLTSKPVPGLGGSINAKYPNSRDQILTQMWDFVRSSVNTFSTAGTPQYFYTPFNTNGFLKGQGQIVPLEPPNGTKGFGRFSTITEAALIFYQKDKLTISGTVPSGGTFVSGTQPPVDMGGQVLTDMHLPDIPEGGTFKITGTNYLLNTETPGPHEIGVVVMLEPFNVTPGTPPWSSNARYVLRGFENFNANGTNFNFPSSMVNLVSSIDSTVNQTALTGIETMFQKPVRHPKTLGPTNPTSPDAAMYPFFTSFTFTGTVMNFSGGTVEIDVYQGSEGPLNADELVQTIKMTFPPVANLPIPSNGIKAITKSSSSLPHGLTTINLSNRSHDTLRNFNDRISFLRRPNDPVGRWGMAESNVHSVLPLIVNAASGAFPGDVVRSVEARYGGPARGDLRLFAGVKTVPEDYFEGHGLKDPPFGGTNYDLVSSAGRLVHSLTAESTGTNDTANQNGYYVGAGMSGDLRGKLVSGVNYPDPNRGNNVRNRKNPNVPRGLQEATMSNGAPGDWDTGVGTLVDGPFINRADEGNANNSMATSTYFNSGGYISGGGVVESGSAFSPNRQIASAVAFGSLPSEINPTNPNASKPWQTLLFGKHPAAGNDHPGFGAPLGGPPFTTAPDHALLDLFTMPIVEPYAISEPFSTAGKVNMNYQIVPFTYLNRNTAIRAVLKSTNMMAIPTTSGSAYKLGNNLEDYRYTLNLNELNGTLEGFERRFNPTKFGISKAPDIFRSASEICDISLVPGGIAATSAPMSSPPSYANMDTWWNNFRLTGDNVREGPYGHIYPRLTTKSNTYTVHVQTQSLAKLKNTPADEFVEGKDQVTGEYRGSFLIERYLDPNSDSLVAADGRTPTNELDPNGMVGPYKFRTISTKRFAP